MPKLHKYILPQAVGDMPFKGNIGRIEYFMHTSFIPLGGGSIAKTDALKVTKKERIKIILR